PGTDSGFSSPIAALPHCSTFNPLDSPSCSRIRRRLSYESIDTPTTRDQATQTEEQLTGADIANCRRIGRKLLSLCDDFDRDFCQPPQSETASSSSSSYFSQLLRRFF
ncbi:hypothetical protein PFISCL1PPCAC_123, partial [Pristionchus fissidentatus]